MNESAHERIDESAPARHPDESAHAEELARTWHELGIDEEHFAMRGETLVATRVAQDRREEGHASGKLPLALGETLGEGGMGRVRAGEQLDLGRRVAIKTLRADAATDANASALIREARVTGRLEHPNVVPIHALGSDGEGRPMIVMKHIEGAPWSEHLDVTPEERRSPAFLGRALEVLKQVAGALEFAHAQGVLHRDVKPENVMIGPFREVYLVDWGIAARLGEHGPPEIPDVREVTAVEGTPVYMAPEMAAGDGSALGVASDVFLLGATLHHVLTGAPPNAANGLHAILLRAFTCGRPSYDAAVPPELAAIARRAMAREPDARFPSAAAFGEALDAYLTHRGSLALCDEGERRAAELERAAPDEIDALFHEARFAFEQALRTWPENPRARKGRRGLIEAMVRHELGRDAPRAARALLTLHEDPPRALRDVVDEALTKAADQAERFAELERDADRSLGARERKRNAYLAAAVLVVVFVALGHVSREGILAIRHWHVAVLGALMLAGSILVDWLHRDVLFANAANRRVVLFSKLGFGGGILLWPLLGAYGLSLGETIVVWGCVAGMLWSAAVLQNGRAWLPLAISHFLAAALAFALPGYHFECFSVVGIGAAWTGAWMERDLR